MEGYVVTTAGRLVRAASIHKKWLEDEQKKVRTEALKKLTIWHADKLEVWSNSFYRRLFTKRPSDPLEQARKTLRIAENGYFHHLPEDIQSAIGDRRISNFYRWIDEVVEIVRKYKGYSEFTVIYVSCPHAESINLYTASNSI